MLQPWRASSHTPAYLEGSPIGQLFNWITQRKGVPDVKNSSRPEPSPRDDGFDLSNEAAAMKTDGAIEGASDAECRVELQGDKEKATEHERFNEAHDWGLARRCVVAGIICLYT